MTVQTKQAATNPTKQEAKAMTWQEGIAAIAATRHKYAGAAKAELAAAEKKLANANKALRSATTGKGSKNSSTPKFQKAKSAQATAQRNVNFLQKTLRIDEDQQELVRIIGNFLNGKWTPDTCGALRLGRTGGDLSIYFHDNGRKVNFDKDHGHFVIYQNGTMSYMRGQSDAHGKHNIVTPRN